MPGSVHSIGIPLSSSGWLSIGYTLTQADVERWLAQLCRALQPLHESSRLYGAVSLDHVLLDPQGKMHIVTERAIPVEVRAASLGLCDGVSSGFAAFEQYVDDPAWPQGPWTDIYGMSALARCLILKQSPPDAVQRMVSDGCEPLRDMGLPDYSREFLDAIDLGMSLLPQQRFANVGAFAQRLGLSLTMAAKEAGELAPAAPVSVSAPAPTPALKPTPAPAREAEEEERKAPIWMMVFVVFALLAAGGYLLRQQGADAPASATQQAPEPVEAPAVAASESETVPAPAPTSESAPAPIAESALATTVESAAAQTAVIDQSSTIDMEAYVAARSELAAAEQEAMAQQIAGQGAEQAEIDATDAEPLQAAQTNEEQAEQARAEAAADVDIRVGLSIRPWGEVFINGASQGVSPPLRSLSLTPGEYRVRIVNGDLPPHQQTLTVKEGESASIAHDFESGG